MSGRLVGAGGAARLSEDDLPGGVLQYGVVYLSPTGRRCRLFGLSSGYTWGTLLYDDADGNPGKQDWRDGFSLSVANFRLLRRVA